MAKRGPKVKKYTPAFLVKLNEKLRKYTDDNDIPIVAEFAYKNDVPRAELYKHPELTHSIKRLIDKKEAQLERKMLSGAPNVATGCIFSLKQLGWKDRQEITGNMEFKSSIEIKTKIKQLEEELEIGHVRKSKKR